MQPCQNGCRVCNTSEEGNDRQHCNADLMAYTMDTLPEVRPYMSSWQEIVDDCLSYL